MDRPRTVGYLVAGIAVAAIGVVLVLTGRHEARRTPIEEVASAPDPEPPPAVPEPEPPATARSRVPPPEPQSLASRIGGFLGGHPRSDPSDEPHSRLRVLVLDPWKRPVEDVKVVASSTGVPPRTLASARGRGDRIELLVPPGEPLRIEARADETLHPRVEESVLAERGEVILVLPLKGARLTGRVVASETGRPDPNAELVYWVEADHDAGVWNAKLSPEGAFDFLVLDGTVQLLATGPRRANAGRCEDVRPGEWRSGIEIALPRPTSASLSGRVTDDLGRPVPGAQVRLDSVVSYEVEEHQSVRLRPVGEAAGDGEGRFRFEEVGAGEQVLRVTAPDLESTGPVRILVKEGENTAEIVLARTGRIRVRGILPDGSRMESGEILLDREGKRVGQAHLFRMRDRRVRGKVLTPSRLNRLLRAARVSGVQVVVEDEAPVTSDPVGLPDEEGFHVLDELPWGSYELRMDSDSSSGRRSVHVDPGGTSTVEVRLTGKD